MSTLNTNIYLVTGISNVGAPDNGTIGTAITLDCYGQMDVILTIQNGILSAQY